MFMQKKNMNFLQAFYKNGLPLVGDVDNDKVINILDCKPYNSKQDGLFGRTVNVLSGGRYGEPKHESVYDKLVRQDQERKQEEFRKQRIEFLEKRNKIIDQQLKIQKLLAKQHQLLYLKKNTSQFKTPAPTQMVMNQMFGFPMDPMMPAANMMPGKPGYEIVYEPRLPKGYKWRKIKK